MVLTQALTSTVIALDAGIFDKGDGAFKGSVALTISV
jgi:hypothetical protein